MEKIDLMNETIMLQRKVNQAWRLHQLGIGTSLPIIMPQLKSPSFITSQGSTSLVKPATTVGVTPTNATSVIDNLVKEDPARRSEDAENRRMLLLRAWKRRHPNSLMRFRERKRDYMSQALAQLSVDELAALVQGLRALAKAVEANKNAV